MSTIRHNVLFKDLCSDLDEHLQKIGSRYSVYDLAGVNTSLDREVFDEELTVQEFAVKAQLSAFLKKFEDGHDSQANAAALDKFLASNVQCKKWSIPANMNMEQELLLGLFKAEIYNFFNPSAHGHILGSFSRILANATTGPGASISANGTDFYTKLFASPLSATRESLYSQYEQHFNNIHFWRDAESQRRTEFGDVEIVEGNRLSFVPKNVDTSRCICIEPALNMFFQQGVKAILEKRLRQYFGISLADQQECNRDLARIGSMSERFCTLDLSSASDTVSLSMIRSTFPTDVVGWLEYFRSPKVQLPSGDWEELHMISSMGNAFTFPLETIIFACVVSAAYAMKDHRLKKGYGSSCEFDPDNGVFVQNKRLPNFGVFGDDIIVEAEHCRHTVVLLELLGFTVNADKSFIRGPFRESCGGDFFRGHPVRGFYLKTLRTQASRYVAINRLNEWSALHGIALRRTIKRLMRSTRYLPVPLYENDDAGVKVPLSMVTSRKWDRDVQSFVYKRWTSVPQKVAIKDGALKLPRGHRSRLYNGDGLLVAMLRGDVRNDSFGSRLGPARYRSKVAVAPNWDWLPTISGGETSLVGQARLAAAIEINLTS